MKIDTYKVLSSADIVEVIGRYLPLKKAGAEHEALCPFHSEGSPSFKVNAKKQIYHCFGCGAHGDAIDFIKEYEGIDFKAACDVLTGNRTPKTDAPVQAKPKLSEREEAKEWVPVMPVSAEAGEPPARHSKKIEGKWQPLDFVSRFAYRDQTGALLGYVARFEYTDKDGKRKKEYVPQTWCRNVQNGVIEWRKVSFPKPRPLYGLQSLAAKPDAIVILCEGEKKADAVERMMPDAVGLSFSGGSKAIKHTAWEPLRGRKVLLWPDADEPGMQAMEGYSNPKTGEYHAGVADYLKDIAAAVKVVVPPESVAESWDLADAEAEGWDADKLGQHVRQAARLPMSLQPKPATPAELTQAEESPMHGEESINYAEPGEQDELPYRALGYDHGKFYYLAGRAAQVFELTSSQHTKLNLMSLATLQFWKERYMSGKDREDAQWDMAANALMRQCEKAGVYDPDRLRGRGAWWDEGRSLLHVGDCLIVDGERKALTDPSVKYIYEAAPALHIDMEDPLPAREAAQLMELTRMLQWEKPISATMLAGWLFLAPICGALAWRPHIWITGGAGTGKTWVQANIVGPVVGNTAVKPMGITSEAGIRQLLGSDARPVIFDEAEGADQKAQDRIQSIMELARQASSETNGGAIVKGSTSGKAMQFRIRSMFAFSSIGVGVQQYADKTRVTVLGLQVDQSKNDEARKAHFDALQAKAASLLTEEYCARLRARAVSMIGAIRQNAKTFAAAGASVIGTQRLGDQIGAMLAGAYALHSNGLISPEDAKAWIEKQDWSDETAMHEVKDEQSCLAHILEYQVRVSEEAARGERQIGELVTIAVKRVPEMGMSVGAAEEYLLRHGIKASGTGIVIANGHTAMAKILTGTLWAREWGRILKRLPGAQPSQPIRFGSGGAHRGVFLPREILDI